MNHSIHKCLFCTEENLSHTIFCQRCGFVVAKEVNFFEILSIAVEFPINIKTLEDNYLKAQIKFHPDRFIAKEEKVKAMAFKYSSLINDAYKCLKNSRLRGEYLLKLKGIFINGDKDNVKPHNELLKYVFELRENIYESDDMEALELLKNDVQKEISNSFTSFENLYNKGLYEHAAEDLIKTRYFEKMLEEIKLRKVENS